MKIWSKLEIKNSSYAFWKFGIFANFPLSIIFSGIKQGPPVGETVNFADL